MPRETTCSKKICSRSASKKTPTSCRMPSTTFGTGSAQGVEDVGHLNDAAGQVQLPAFRHLGIAAAVHADVVLVGHDGRKLRYAGRVEQESRPFHGVRLHQ